MFKKVFTTLILFISLVLGGLAISSTDVHAESADPCAGITNTPGNTELWDCQDKQDKICFNAIFVDNGLGISGLANPARFIPLVPSACKGPMKINLIIPMLMRTYNFLASIGVALLLIAIAVIGIRWLVGSFSETGGYLNVKKDLKNVFIALFILLSVSTLIFELVKLLGFDPASVNISNADGSVEIK